MTRSISESLLLVRRAVLVGDGIAMPDGLGGTIRFKLLARGLAEAGIAVAAIVVRPTDPRGTAPVRGEFNGIPYVYAAGTTRAAGGHLARSVQVIRGIVGTVLLLLRHRLTARSKTAVLIYSRTFTVVAVVGIAARIFGLSSVLEVCEWPETQPAASRREQRRQRRFCRRALWYVDGAVVISQFIADRIDEFRSRTGKPIDVLLMPIIAEAGEFACSPSEGSGLPYVLLTADLSYRDVVSHTLQAFARIAIEHPSLELVITGDSTRAGRRQEIEAEATALGVGQRIRLAGFVERAEMVRLMKGARALLIPLADDALSRARFPTKIAEYLLSGRPVVTSAVGDIPRYLEDNVSAYLALPGDAAAFADRLRQALTAQDADEVAARGRAVAIHAFDYQAQGRRLAQWLTTSAASPVS